MPVIEMVVKVNKTQQELQKVDTLKARQNQTATSSSATRTGHGQPFLSSSLLKQLSPFKKMQK